MLKPRMHHVRRAALVQAMIDENGVVDNLDETVSNSANSKQYC